MTTNEINGNRLIHWAAGLVLLMVASAVFAQLPTATILGLVKDSSGAALPNATVTVSNTETGLTRTVTTGADGGYRVPALPIGGYAVKVEGAGFQTQTSENIILTVGEEAVLNFSLKVGATHQVITVSAEAPQINTTNSSLGNLIDESQMRDLPLNGRNWMTLATLQPGVTQGSNFSSAQGFGGTFISSNGAPVRSNTYLLDGAPMTNAWGVNPNSVAGTTLGVDGIREFKVITNMFGAEYGMAMGSQMVLVSKGGTNQFHGDAFDYLRNAALDARNYFDALGLNGTSLPYPGRRLPPYQRNNFGGAFGGPVRKDKTFFFGVYEGFVEHLGTTNINTTLPAACHTANNIVGPACDPALSPGTPVAPQMQPFLALYPVLNLPNDNFTYPYVQVTNVHYGQMRVDQNFSNRDTLFGRYTISDSESLKPASYPQIQSDWIGRDQYLTLSESHIFSTALLNAAQLSYSRSNVLVKSVQPTLLTAPYSFVSGHEMGALLVGSTPAFGTFDDRQHQRQNIFVLGDDLVWVKGKHSLKMGALITRNQNYVINPFFVNGLDIFPTAGSLVTGVPIIQQVEAPGSKENRDYRYYSYGFYVQDDFRVSPRLTLNLGLRYEFWTVPREQHGLEAALRHQTDPAMTLGPIMEPRSKTNFGPRLGLAWDIFGDGKTSLRSGFGLYYDIGNIFGILLNTTSGAPFANAIASSPLFPPPFNGPFTIPFTIPQGTLPPNIDGPSYDLAQPRLYQYNLTVEHEFPGSLALRVGYVGSKGTNLYVITEGNPIPPASSAACTAAGLVSPCWMPNTPRINPSFASFYDESSLGKSWYNSLQVNLLKRFSKGLQFQSSYTYSKLLDYGQGMLQFEGSSANSVLIDPFDPAYNKGLADMDLRHNFQFNAQYQLPSPTWDNLAGKALKGWWVGSIVTIHSGYPITPTIISQQSGQQLLTSGAPTDYDRPNFVTNANLAQAKLQDPLAQVYGANTVIIGKPSQWFNPHMFTLQPFGTLGDVPRGAMSGPGSRDWDFSINKDTALPFMGEAGKLEFRAEVFNVLNHANFNIPVVASLTPSTSIFAGGTGPTAGLPIPNAGQITSTVTTSRQIQIALKLIF